MRQWMVDPRIMCHQHLLAEHYEIHMYVGAANKGINLQGYYDSDVIEPQSFKSRHDELVSEMLNRGYTHKSPLKPLAVVLPDHTMDKEASLKELLRRCPHCKTRYEFLQSPQ